MEAIELTFTVEKHTKNTTKFAEDERPGKPPVIGSLYVQKWAVGDQKTLKVTVSPR